MSDFDAADLRAAIRKLSEKEKEALLLRSVRRDAEWRATVAFELLPEFDRDKLYEATTDRIHELITGVPGFQLARYLTKAIRKSTDQIGWARRVSGDRTLEIDLYAYLLRLLFDNYSGQLDSSFRLYYTTVARLQQKLGSLIRKYLHEDLWLDYQDEFNDWLGQLRTRPDRVSTLSFELPAPL